MYVGLDALSDSTIAAAVGSSMFSDLCSIAGQLYKFGVEAISGHHKYKNKCKRECKNNSQSHFNKNHLNAKAKAAHKTLYRISVHGDEFNEIANDDVTTLLNKGGGAGLQMTLYTQTWSDVEAKLGNSAKAGQVAGNLNTLVCLRVLDEATAKLFTSKLAQRVPIYSLQPYSSVTDMPKLGSAVDFTSSNDDRLIMNEVPLLTPHDLIQLPKGQAYCLIEGGQLWKIRMPLPQDAMRDISETIEKIAHVMRENAVTRVTENQNTIHSNLS